jgi:hypothetical protein
MKLFDLLMRGFPYDNNVAVFATTDKKGKFYPESESCLSQTDMENGGLPGSYEQFERCDVITDFIDNYIGEEDIVDFLREDTKLDAIRELIAQINAEKPIRICPDLPEVVRRMITL